MPKKIVVSLDQFTYCEWYTLISEKFEHADDAVRKEIDLHDSIANGREVIFPVYHKDGDKSTKTTVMTNTRMGPLRVRMEEIEE